MRAIWDYKIVKQESWWKPVNAFITNIEWESIRLKIWWDKIDISYKEFLEIKENKELYELFSWVIRELWENPDDFFNINKEIIEWIWEYKDKIWAPSTKTIIDKK
jgi:hypothetical protein